MVADREIFSSRPVAFCFLHGGLPVTSSRSMVQWGALDLCGGGRCKGVLNLNVFAESVNIHMSGFQMCVDATVLVGCKFD